MGEEADSDITCVENALWDHKIRLAASLARCRVRSLFHSLKLQQKQSVYELSLCIGQKPIPIH